MKLGQLVTEFLKQRENERFIARDIAKWIFVTYPAECETKKRNSKFIKTDDELIQQLVAEIGANRPNWQKKHPQLRTTEGRPRKYYWTNSSDEAEAIAPVQAPPIPEPTSATTLSEHSLYPLLVDYAWSEHGLYTRRIDEKRASNRRGPQGNRWLYPDLVAMEDLTREWTKEIKDCVSELAARQVRLWSFEVKISLNRSNVRECYFQAVSNSSWANLGYLVAAEIEGADTLKELRILSALHGIGVLELDRDNVAESQILIPARERQEVDWGNCNRLADENPDFAEVIKLVRQFHQTGDPRRKDWNQPTPTVLLE